MMVLSRVIETKDATCFISGFESAPGSSWFMARKEGEVKRVAIREEGRSR